MSEPLTRMGHASLYLQRRNLSVLCLQVKVKVLESAAASLRRAQINRALALKLEEVLRVFQ